MWLLRRYRKRLNLLRPPPEIRLPLALAVPIYYQRASTSPPAHLARRGVRLVGVEFVHEGARVPGEGGGVLPGEVGVDVGDDIVLRVWRWGYGWPCAVGVVCGV